MGGAGGERVVAFEFVIRGDRGEREIPLDIGIREPVARAQAKPRQHGEALAVEALVAGMVDTGLEAHLADMPGGAGGDLQRPHLGRRGDGILHPDAGKVIPVRDGGKRDQHDNRMAVPVKRRAALQPRALRYLADADLVRIHEIGAALDVLRAPVEPGRHGGRLRRAAAFRKAREQRPVAKHGRAERPAGFRRRRGPGRQPRRLRRGHRLVARQHLHGIGPKVERPVLRCMVKQHGSPRLRLPFAIWNPACRLPALSTGTARQADPAPRVSTA